ncbi:hypothetical protein L226DRAFT_531392 [Lentinus tigrinus ALCF2SS1-7]|uniref:Uncharacterized protein n=1 Tax=Lentinus tigrinus ALCF2SS1-6 TaxID=1328759 RepID=A0A5C2RQ96_9APHY|nr:hypothetical protein L227DRAFT_581159 [Lentinus tigrinus ALCF2SS1-6]RPD79635.1 hypothetical protein L226DRAFT_531392 [Lentinus tigrinus ALCF2SS1-7]
MSSTNTVALKGAFISDAVPVGKWLERHHVVYDEKRSGKTYHAFVQGGYPLVGPDPKASYDIEVDVPLGPVILQLRGSINTSTLEADIGLYVKVPFLPAIKLGELSGNLRDGITISVGVPGILEGSVTLYISDDNWLHIKFTLTIFGEEYSADIALFPIPWL